ncbi:MAG: CBS domain-containing protein [Massilia sp.]
MDFTTSIKQIMTTRIVTVELDDKLSMVSDIFKSSKFHHLLAVEDRELIGIVSDGDLFKAISPNIGSAVETYKDTATLNKRVHQIMSRHPVVLTDEATFGDAIDLFNEKNVSCIPIVNAANRPVGIVSWRDILKHLR